MTSSDLTPEMIYHTTRALVRELIERAGLKPGRVLVVGGSSSEIAGGRIGKQSSLGLGYAVAKGVIDEAALAGVETAFQGCEHINRALIVERRTAERLGLQEVCVVPALHAGGAVALSAYALADDPVATAHITADAGLDIGDTCVGMHVRFVQVPLRLASDTLGAAHVTALTSRPPRIGGERAVYAFDRERFELDLAAEEGLGNLTTNTPRSV